MSSSLTIANAALDDIPGEWLIRPGLVMLARGQRALQSMFVAMAWPRLEPLGLATRAAAEALATDGEELAIGAYRLCQALYGREAHARYLALEAELDSGLTALERRARLAGDDEATRRR